MNAVLAITLKMHLTLSFGFTHKILHLHILVVIYNRKCMHCGNCIASIWFSYMVHVIFKLKV